MTRRLRPPAPLWVRCHPDGRPASLRRGGRERTVTRIAATWVRPAPWWITSESDMQSPGVSSYPTSALDEERSYFRVVLDGIAVQEIFSTPSGAWYLERVID